MTRALHEELSIIMASNTVALKFIAKDRQNFLSLPKSPKIPNATKIPKITKKHLFLKDDQILFSVGVENSTSFEIPFSASNFLSQ